MRLTLVTIFSPPRLQDTRGKNLRTSWRLRALVVKQWGGTNRKAAGRLLDGRTWDEFPLNDQETSRH
jgi:protein gp37